MDRNMLAGVAAWGITLVLSGQPVKVPRLRYVTMESQPLAIADAASSRHAKGLFPDILEELLTRRMGRTWDCTLLPWKRAQLELQSGKADLTITIPTQERRAYTLVSRRPVLQMYLQIYTFKNHPRLSDIRKIRTAQDILRLRLVPVTNLGNNWHRENIDAFGIKTHYAPAEQNIVKILASERADIMIDSPITMDPMIRSLGLEGQIEKTPARFGPLSFHLLIGKRSPLAASMKQIDETIAQMIQDGTLDRLVANDTTP